MFCLILVIAYCMSQIYLKKSNIATLPYKNILRNPYACNRTAISDYRRLTQQDGHLVTQLCGLFSCSLGKIGLF